MPNYRNSEGDGAELAAEAKALADDLINDHYPDLQQYNV